MGSLKSEGSWNLLGVPFGLRQSSDLLQEFADWVWPSETCARKRKPELSRGKPRGARRPGFGGLAQHCIADVRRKMEPFFARRTFVKTMNENLTRPVEGCRCDSPGHRCKILPGHKS